MEEKNIYFQFLKKNIFIKFLSKKISKLLNKKNTFITSNCSTSIYLLLKSLDIKNKKIIIPSNVCFDVMLSIIFSGNHPVIIDINNNLGFSLSDLKKEIKKQKIAALIFPYLYGNSDNIKSIIKMIKKKNIILIEDIAPAFGGKFGRKNFGSFSDYCVGSFGQGKIIDMNKGGFFSTNNDKIFNKFKIKYKKLKIYSKKNSLLYKKLNKVIDKILRKKIKNKFLKQSLLSRYYLSIIYRRNFNLSFYEKLDQEISKIEKTNNLRNRKAMKFSKELNFQNFRSINHKVGSTYWRKNFILRENSHDLISFLNKQNIYARNYYPPLNLIFPFIKKKFKNSEKKYRKIINFWVGEETKFKDIKKIKQSITNYYNASKTTFTSP